MPISKANTIVFSVLALIAFAANSVLCRLALGSDSIDAASFTVLRLLSGSLVLWLIVSLSRKKTQTLSKGSNLAGLMLFTYAATFSYAYISLDTATGAFILFAVIQIAMIVMSLLAGHRLLKIEWAGVVIAFFGFVYLVSPGVSAPPLKGALLMTLAGLAWSVYSMLGKGSTNPLTDTAYNFIRTIPWVAVLAVLGLSQANYSPAGIMLALLSGGITSGIGYALWYMALGGLSTTQAAVMQLSVPIIAALGGVIFVSEAVTLRLLIAATLVLSGILLVVWARKQTVRG